MGFSPDFLRGPEPDVGKEGSVGKEAPGGPQAERVRGLQEEVHTGRSNCRSQGPWRSCITCPANVPTPCRTAPCFPLPGPPHSQSRCSSLTLAPGVAGALGVRPIRVSHTPGMAAPVRKGKMQWRKGEKGNKTVTKINDGVVPIKSWIIPTPCTDAQHLCPTEKWWLPRSQQPSHRKPQSRV